MAIYDIRGTNGSGKSHLMNSILDMFGAKEINGVVPGKKKSTVLGYKLSRWNGIVLGRYTPTGGGCDGISPPTEVERRIDLYAKPDNDVFLEGILVAHTFDRYNKQAIEKATKGIPYHFCFLDTPWVECLRRIIARRQAVGNTRPFNPENAKYDFRRIWGTVRYELVNAKRLVTVLDHRAPLDQLLTMISRGPQNKQHGNVKPMPKVVRLTGKDAPKE